MKAKESEKIYRYSVDMTGDGIFFVDCESGRITDTNEMAHKMLKYSRSELLSMYIWELQPEGQMHVAKALWQKIKKAGCGRRGGMDYLAKDGTTIQTSVSASTISTGDVNFIQWICRDTSEYRNSLDKADFFRLLLEKLNEAVLVTDTRGKIRYANRAFRMLFDIDRDPDEDADILAPDLMNPGMTVLRTTWSRLKGKDFLIDEVRIDSRHGDAIKKTLAILPYRGDQGNVKYYLWFFHPPAEAVNQKQVKVPI